MSITFDIPKQSRISWYTQAFVTLDGTFRSTSCAAGRRPLGPQVTNLVTRDILGHPNLFCDILCLSTRRFLSCRGSRIAPYDRMNVPFFVYADNAVYQTCTPTVKSHAPDKGTISVAAFPGSAHRFRGHASLSGSLRLVEFQCEARGKSLAEKMCKFLSKRLTQNLQRALSFACIFEFMSPKMHKKYKKLEYEVLQVHTNTTNMKKYAPPLC